MKVPKLKKKPGPKRKRNLPFIKSKSVASSDSDHSKFCLICLKRCSDVGNDGSPKCSKVAGSGGVGGIGTGGGMSKVVGPVPAAGVKRKRGRPPKQRLQDPSSSSCHGLDQRLPPTVAEVNGQDSGEVPAPEIRGGPEDPANVEAGGRDLKVFLDFLRIVNRYLDIRTKPFSSLMGLEGEGAAPPFCEGCLHSVRKFCEVFREWERARMFLHWRLMEISEKIRRSRSATLKPRYKVWCRIMSKQLKAPSPISIDMFRKQLGLRCSAKARNMGPVPKVSLDRCRWPCSNTRNLKSPVPVPVPVDPSLQCMKSLIAVFALANLDKNGPTEAEVICKGELEVDNTRESNPSSEYVYFENEVICPPMMTSPGNGDVDENDVGRDGDIVLADGDTESDMVITRNEEEPSAASIEEEKSAPVLPTRRFNLRKRIKSSITMESEGWPDDSNDNDYSSESSDSCMDSDNSWNGNDSNSELKYPTKYSTLGPKFRKSSSLPDNSEKVTELDSHIKDAPTTNPFLSYPSTCSICQQTFPNMKVLLKHRRDIHKDKKASRAYTCEICGVNRKGKVALAGHMKSHIKGTKEKVHKCTKCSRNYKAKRYLRRHMRRHEINGPDWKPAATVVQNRVKCEADGCEKMFVCESSFEVHSTLHPSDGFKCSVCEEPFPRYQSMLSHLQTVHEKGSEEEEKREGENLHSCRHCCKFFILEQTRDLHAKILHPQVYKLQCDSEFCTEEFDTTEELRNHLRSTHLPPDVEEVVEDLDEAIQFFRPSSSKSDGDNAENSKDEIERLGLFTCKRCGWSFPSRTGLTSHLLAHLKIHQQKLSCILCDQVDSTYGLPELQVHFSGVHGATNKRYWCSLCQETVLYDHMKGHTAVAKRRGRNIDRPRKKYPGKYVCDQCPDSERFTSSWVLLRHKIADHGQRIKCEFEGCPKTFSNRADMKSHLKCHYKKIPCPIDSCPIRFPDNHHLRAHLKTHRQEKEHICQYCGKTFLLKHGLKMHLDIHLENKKWKCSYCDKAFCRKYAMECHERIHTKEKPFLCKFCGKGFSQQVTLRTHERIHSNEKPFLCKVCGKGFSQKNALKTHEKVHEKVKVKVK